MAIASSSVTNGEARSEAILNVLPLPVIVVAADGRVVEANLAAQSFFQMSRSVLRRLRLDEVVPFGSPILSLIEQVRANGGSVSEYRVDIGTPRIGTDKVVDLYATLESDDAQDVVVMLQEKTIAEKMDRQLTHRGAARSISAMGSMLAHEIKNPLSGIRGAAQLLETSVTNDDQPLLRLICDETDRIVKLVDRFENFADGGPLEREAINIHSVLEHVKRLASSGFARHIRFSETYDPSLPPVWGNRDQLIQVFLNLVKNAAEAIGPDALDGEIELATAYRAGVRMVVPGSNSRVALPLEICVRDNGPGVPENLMRTLFDPFISTKASGTGLGLALVSKIVGDHGGVVECESLPRRTVFRVLMSMQSSRDAGVTQDNG
jgi:two-component system, NtrC family, nitrogen regulation sensor histidine kinase GlnL